MIIQNHNVYTEISECKSLAELYSEGEKLGENSVLLVHADNMEDAVADDTRAWLLSASFITVLAAENAENFSYELMSLFDVRLSGKEYPAASAKADERYKLLCGETAYEMLAGGETENAPNFVTVLSGEGDFGTAAREYIEHICAGKTPEQLKVLTGCLKAAVSGGTDAVLSAESNGFYTLMAQKTEVQSDE